MYTDVLLFDVHVCCVHRFLCVGDIVTTHGTNNVNSVEHDDAIEIIREQNYFLI
jgi:hypothetical protein